jgi:hypothetical protein
VIEILVEHFSKFGVKVMGVEEKRATNKAIITSQNTLFTKSKTVSWK